MMMLFMLRTHTGGENFNYRNTSRNNGWRIVSYSSDYGSSMTNSKYDTGVML